MMSDGRPLTVDRRSSLACGVCGTLAEIGARYCIHCGHPFPPVGPIGLRCPACHSINLLGEPFCEVCGSPLPVTPYLVITETGLRLPIFSGEQASLVVGRADALTGVFPEIDLSPYGADAAGLSRHHARLTRKDDQYWLEDLNSVNLTYLNDQRLTPDRPVRLKDGDLIRLARLLVTFRAG
ncbi:MAG: FHA domain-containing protein [Chloroflexi bacterium]|nr:FHA domain-containing protein [Chloroflexota bacterium]